MYFFTVIAFASLPFLVAAVPVSQDSSLAKGPISFSLTKHLNHSNSDGLVDPRKVQAAIHQTAMRYDRAFSTYEKRTGETHPLALKRRHSNERRAVDNSLTEQGSQENAFWTLDVTVGTPGNVFSLALDTISADSFLSGVSCLTCFEKKRYDFTLSSTAKDMKTQTTLTRNVEGPVTGEIVSDMIGAGGVDANVLMVVATKIDIALQFPNFQADGIMGLGLKSTSSIGASTWFETVSANNTAIQSLGGDKVFGLTFAKTGTGPQIIFGGRDNNKFVGSSLTYVGMPERPAFWQIKVDSVTVNGKGIKTPTTTAIVDTSTSFIGGDSDDIANLYSNIPGSFQGPGNDLYTIPCNTTVPVVFGFGGKEFILTPPIYNLGPLDSTGTLCQGGFGVLNRNAWTLGTIWMEAVYTEFDEGKNRVGFGPST